MSSRNFREAWFIFCWQMSAFSEKRRCNRILINYRFWHKATLGLLKPERPLLVSRGPLRCSVCKTVVRPDIHFMHLILFSLTSFANV